VYLREKLVGRWRNLHIEGLHNLLITLYKDEIVGHCRMHRANGKYVQIISQYVSAKGNTYDE
jgi:hypothetical protein